MKTAAVTDLKNRLSHFLRLVARGETVTVLDRGRPVARITRVEGSDDELDELIAAGMARGPLQPLPADFFTRALPPATSNLSDAVVADREDRF